MTITGEIWVTLDSRERVNWMRCRRQNATRCPLMNSLPLSESSPRKGKGSCCSIVQGLENPVLAFAHHGLSLHPAGVNVHGV